MDSTWSKLSQPVKTIMERVDINKRDLTLKIGQELEIPYFKGIITQQIVDEIKWLEKEEKNEGYFRTEQERNTFTIKFLKSAF